MSEGDYQAPQRVDEMLARSPRSARGVALGRRARASGPGFERIEQARPPAGPRDQIRRYGAGRTLLRHVIPTVPAGGFSSPSARDPMRIIREDASAVAAGLPLLGGATVLVSGTNGMLGGYLVAILEAAGARVVTAERCGASLVVPSDPVEHVIQAALPTDPDLFRSDPADAMVATTSMLAQLLEHARAHSAHVTFVSTVEASRLDLANTRSFYPAVGRAAEALCAAYRQQYGVATSIIRLAHVYGPGFHLDDPRVWAEFTRAAVDGEPVVVRSTDDRRLPWTYVADAADAVLRTALTGVERDATVAFEAVDDRSRCDIRAFARAVLHSGGRPPALAYQLSTPERTPVAPPQPVRRAERPPDWKPRTRMADGVDRTVRWYQDVSAAAPAEAMSASGG